MNTLQILSVESPNQPATFTIKASFHLLLMEKQPAPPLLLQVCVENPNQTAPPPWKSRAALFECKQAPEKTAFANARMHMITSLLRQAVSESCTNSLFSGSTQSFFKQSASCFVSKAHSASSPASPSPVGSCSDSFPLLRSPSYSPRPSGWQ